MSAPAPVTEATLRRAINAARKSGLTVIGIRPDGTVLVSSGENPILDTLRDEMTRHDAEAQKWAIRG